MARDIQRVRLFTLIGFLAIIVCLGLAALIAVFDGRESVLPHLLQSLGFIAAVAIVFAYVVVPRAIKGHSVWVGGDFLSIEGTPPQGYASIAKYDEISAVRIRMAKCRMVGAIIITRGGPVLIRRIRDPAVVLRAIFDRAPENVKWRRTWRPLTRLKRDKVRQMLEQAGASDLDSLLPPGRAYSCADEVFSRDRPVDPRPGWGGFWAKCFRGTRFETSFMSPELPTPASLYVGFMLRQMFDDGSTTHVLKRSEPLPTLTLDSETAAAPPLKDVLNRLKNMCGIDPSPSTTSTKGAIKTMMVTSSDQPQPCTFHCRFDDEADACCEIRMEIPALRS